MGWANATSLTLIPILCIHSDIPRRHDPNSVFCHTLRSWRFPERGPLAPIGGGVNSAPTWVRSSLPPNASKTLTFIACERHRGEAGWHGSQQPLFAWSRLPSISALSSRMKLSPAYMKTHMHTQPHTRMHTQMYNNAYTYWPPWEGPEELVADVHTH